MQEHFCDILKLCCRGLREPWYPQGRQFGKDKASIPTDDLIPKLGLVEISSLWHFRPIANTEVYEGSFFPQIIRDWNARPDSLISSAKDPEDSVAK